ACDRPRAHSGWSERASMQDERFHYIRAPRPELYDLQADPREVKDRSREDAARLASLDNALDAHLHRVADAAAAHGPQAVDSETEEKLAALGYVGATGGARNLDERPRGDPKDKIGLYNLI